MGYKKKEFAGEDAETIWSEFNAWAETITGKIISKSMISTETGYDLKVFYFER